MEANLQREKLINYSEQQCWCLHYCLDTVYPNNSWTKIEAKKSRKGKKIRETLQISFQFDELIFVHSKCKRSRSQCWRRLFLWFSNTVTIMLTESRLRWKTTFVKSNKCVTNIDEIMQIMRRTQIDCKQSSLLSKCFCFLFFAKKQ